MNSTLLDKMASLERRVRTLRLVVIALAACQILWILMGAAQQKEDDQKVRRFSIVDKNGKPRIKMQTDEAGNPSISLLDDNGAKRLGLDLDDLGAVVRLRGTNKASASLRVQPEGLATLMLEGDGPSIRMTAIANGQERYSDIIVADDAVESEARIATQDGGSIFTLNKGGGVPVAFHIDRDGTTGLTISDDKELERVRLLLDPKGSSTFQVLDKDGKAIAP